MSERVTMPALGESVTEGTVTRWLKNVGETIEIDEPLLEVSTDKVDTEIPSPVSGTVLEILAAEDDTVPVGADLAVIGDPTEQNGGAPSPEPAASPAPDPAAASSQEPAADQLPPPAEAPSTAIEPDEEAKAPKASTGTTDSAGTTITMPALGESVTEGTVTRWLKAEGDQVETDEALLEVSTDKVDTEIPSPVSGTLTKILVAEDETVPVGADLAVIGGQSGGSAESDSTPEPESTPERKPAPAPTPVAAEPAEEPDQPHPAAETSEEPAEAAIRAESNDPSLSADDVAEPTEFPQSNATAPASGREQTSAGQQGAEAAAYVTPLVRKLAGQHHVDLTSLSGTGVGGRIRKQDVLDAAKDAGAKAAAAATASESAASPAPAAASASSPAAGRPAAQPTAFSVSPKRGTTEKMSRLRKVIAQRMVESLQVSAQLTTVVEVDVTRIARLRDRAKRDFETREGVKLSYLPFFALAAVEALKQHPTVNASVDGDQITYHGAEHLGVAVDTERGLLVPVIRDAGDLNIAGLSRKIADLAARTRGNKITPDELGGGTFTLTNTGSRGALFDTPIINQPQVAILGTGSVVRRPVVVADQDGGETIAIRSMMYLALSYDHRIVDGADGARFLTTMKTRLEEGAFEASLGL